MSARKKNTPPLKDASAPVAAPKKPYTTPRLTTYGSIENLTKAGGNTTKDKGNNKQN